MLKKNFFKSLVLQSLEVDLYSMPTQDCKEALTLI